MLENYDDDEDMNLNHEIKDTNKVEDNLSVTKFLATGETPPKTTFDYLYEFSETRKVLEEFFKCPPSDDTILDPFKDSNESDDFENMVSFLDNISFVLR